MEWTISFRDDPRIVVMKVSGLFTIEGCRTGIAELAAVKDPLMPLLFDDRDVDFSAVSDLDLMEMSSMLLQYERQFAYSKIAVLVSKDMDREIAEKWRSLAKHSTGSLIGVFFDEAEAIEWLTAR